MMQKLIIALLISSLFGCIGTDIVDDAVPPRVAIKNPIDSLKVGESYLFEAKYYDESGQEVPATIEWKSTNEEIVSISAGGLALALMPGETEIIASFQDASNAILLVSGENTSVVVNARSATLSTVSSYPLDGTVSLEQEEGGSLFLRFSDDFNTTSALPGLYVYLSNNVTTKANAYEVGAVTQFTGAQEYSLPPSVHITDYDYVLFYCKPFNVPVGNGQFMP